MSRDLLQLLSNNHGWYQVDTKKTKQNSNNNSGLDNKEEEF